VCKCVFFLCVCVFQCEYVSACVPLRLCVFVMCICTHVCLLVFGSSVCGALHTCAVSEDGTLWVWGAGDDGQLGVGVREPRLMPARIGGSDVFGCPVLSVAAVFKCIYIYMYMCTNIRMCMCKCIYVYIDM